MVTGCRRLGGLDRGMSIPGVLLMAVTLFFVVCTSDCFALAACNGSSLCITETEEHRRGAGLLDG